MNGRGKHDGKVADEKRSGDRDASICGKVAISPVLFLSKNRRFMTW